MTPLEEILDELLSGFYCSAKGRKLLADRAAGDILALIPKDRDINDAESHTICNSQYVCNCCFSRGYNESLAEVRKVMRGEK